MRRAIKRLTLVVGSILLVNGAVAGSIVYFEGQAVQHTATTQASSSTANKMSVDSAGTSNTLQTIAPTNQQDVVSSAENYADSSANYSAPRSSSSSAAYYSPQCTYRAVPYKTTYKNVSWLDKGKTMEGFGANGTEKICSNKYGSPTVTMVVSPSDKVISVGTREPYRSSYSTPSYSGYYNSSGNYIPSPSTSGATTGGYSPNYTCADGTYSYAQSSRGACSYHGGIR